MLPPIPCRIQYPNVYRTACVCQTKKAPRHLACVCRRPPRRLKWPIPQLEVRATAATGTVTRSPVERPRYRTPGTAASCAEPRTLCHTSDTRTRTARLAIRRPVLTLKAAVALGLGTASPPPCAETGEPTNSSRHVRMTRTTNRGSGRTLPSCWRAPEC